MYPCRFVMTKQDLSMERRGAQLDGADARSRARWPQPDGRTHPAHGRRSGPAKRCATVYRTGT